MKNWRKGEGDQLKISKTNNRQKMMMDDLRHPNYQKRYQRSHMWNQDRQKRGYISRRYTWRDYIVGELTDGDMEMDLVGRGSIPPIKGEQHKGYRRAGAYDEGQAKRGEGMPMLGMKGSGRTKRQEHC